jgi:hypothetical protein
MSLLVGVIFVPYEWVVIPYFANVFLIITTVALALVKYFHEKPKMSFVYTLSWLAGVVLVPYEAWRFSQGNYLHSYTYLVAGTFHILGLCTIFALNMAPIIERKSRKSGSILGMGSKDPQTELP